MNKLNKNLFLSGILTASLVSSPVYSSSKYVSLNDDSNAINLRNSFRFLEYSEVLDDKLDDLEEFMKSKTRKDYNLQSEYQLLVSQVRGVNSILNETSKKNSSLDKRIRKLSGDGVYSEHELQFSRNSLKFGDLSCDNPSKRMVSVYSSLDLVSKVQEIANENLAVRVAHFGHDSEFFRDYSSNFESVRYTIDETRRIQNAQNDYPDLSFRLVASAKNLLRGLDIGLSQKGGKLNSGKWITESSAIGLANMSYYVFGDKKSAEKILSISGVSLNKVDLSGDSLGCEIDHFDRDSELARFNGKTRKNSNVKDSKSLKLDEKNSSENNNNYNVESDNDESSVKKEVKKACEKSLGTTDDVLGFFGVKNICE